MSSYKWHLILLTMMFLILNVKCLNRTTRDNSVSHYKHKTNIEKYLLRIRKLDFTKDILEPIENYINLNWIEPNVTNKITEVMESDTLTSLFERRTFGGHRKRMQFALLPIMYKMGVMTTLLGFLTVLTLKGLTIGVILLIFAFGSIFSKFSHVGHYKDSGWQQQHQPIHVHLHSADPHVKTTSYSYSPGPGQHGWDRIADSPNYLTYTDNSPRPNIRWESYPPERYFRPWTTARSS